jgi:hypothetical protein
MATPTGNENSLTNRKNYMSMHILPDKLRHTLLLGVVSTLLFSCQKSAPHFDDPYAGGKQSLGIHFSTDLPSPESGAVGTTVTYKVTGLESFKDSLNFYVNNEKCQVVALDSTSIKVKVPSTASTGVASATVGDQIFFGPVFRVSGKLGIDNNFKATVGANNSIQDYLPLSNGRIILVGSFSDFNHKGAVKPLNRIVQISKDGDVVRTLKTGKAVDGNLAAIAQLPNKRMLIAGAFSSYDVHQGEIHNITLLNQNGSLDSMVVRTFSDLDTVPAFNGGTDGYISRLFVNGNQITAVGNFRYYLQHVYNQSNAEHTLDTLITDSVEVRNVARFFADGSLDSSFNYNFYQHKSKSGTNGPVTDAYMQDDGKLVMVGNFSNYDDETVNYIVRINPDGSIDRSFKVGNGADNPIASVRYNETTHHYILAGVFRHFNGEEHNGLVMLNEDGSIVESFKPSAVGNDDQYFFAQQLSNGLVIVNGYFKTYAGIQRGNFMVLDPTGKLAQGYNTTGNFNGVVFQAYETKNSAGQTTVMLMGSFNKFDEQSMGNITRVVLKN